MASMLYSHLPSIVGVLGAGSMGTQIAGLCASKGFTVLLNDVTQHALDHSKQTIHETLQAHAKQGYLTTVGVNEAMSRIQTSLKMEPYTTADFVIEAAEENEETKKSIFRRLDQVAPVHALLASSTSSISISRLATKTTKPHRVVGMHFASPLFEVQASSDKLVELAKGMHTSNQTFVNAKSFARSLGCTTVVSADQPGFVLYRVLMPLINEAFFCLSEGTSSAQEIDCGLRIGMCSKQGPLTKADTIGLDTCLNIMKVLHQHLGDKYRPSPLLAQYVDAGWLGVKTGRGVFSWRASKGMPPTAKKISPATSSGIQD